MISTGDIYNFHSVRKELFVTFQDSESSKHFIPVSSSAMFGLIFDPVGDTAKALKGYHFQTIGELMLKNIPFPRVVRATKSFNCAQQSQTSESVDADEILAIKNTESLYSNVEPLITALSLPSSKRPRI